jgi:hypothetical protein
MEYKHAAPFVWDGVLTRILNAAHVRSALVLTALIAASALIAVKAHAAEWVDVTHNVGGEKWGAYGVHYMSAVPHSNAVIAGVSEAGLWESTDEGATWKKLGGNEIRSRPDRIVYDPKDSAIFWVSGCYGDSPFRTDDGGKTFQRLGNLSHSDGIAVDFTDPERRTLLLGLHEQSQSLDLSTDKGKSWTKIGSHLPDNTNHSSDPVVINSKHSSSTRRAGSRKLRWGFTARKTPARLGLKSRISARPASR